MEKKARKKECVENVGGRGEGKGMCGRVMVRKGGWKRERRKGGLNLTHIAG